MLSTLSGPHASGADRGRVCDRSVDCNPGLSRSEVTFRAISRAEAARYWETGEPRDKAGGYAIQGLAAVFVADLQGSYSGVMGLPLFETAALLAAAGVPRWRTPQGRPPCPSRSSSTRASTKRAPRWSRTACCRRCSSSARTAAASISNIYKGRVSRVLPGMQAAFIEIGLRAHGVSACLRHLRPATCGHRHRAAAHRQHPGAGRRGQRDPGAGRQGSARHQGRAADDLHHAAVALPRVHAAGPRRRRVGAHRGRSRARAAARRGPGVHGLAERTPATSCAPRPRARAPRRCAPTCMYLRRLWQFVRRKGAAHRSPGNLVHEDLPLHLRMLRDLLRPDVERVLVDQASAHREMQEFARTFMPDALSTHRAVRPSRARCSNCTTSRRRSRRRWTARCR